MKILVINPGSTSTKVSLFEGEKNLFTDSVFHDAPVLLRYKEVNDQLPFRSSVVLGLLKKHGYSLSDCDVFVGRGGCAYPQKAKVMVIDKRLNDDTARDAGGSDHPAKLGVMMAYQFMRETGKSAYTVNPTNVDELCPWARLTGIRGLYRRAQTHALNQKEVARLEAKRRGRRYEDCSFIVCHIDGGITITAHEKGRMVDGTEGAGGDGPYTPSRVGSVPVLEIAKYLENHDREDLKRLCSRSGGFVSHFGTSDANKVHALVEAGDEKAKTIWFGMAYQICKEIGAMAAVLSGKVDAIILTGGLSRFPDLVSFIEKRCSFIAPFALYPGEVEQEAMAGAVLDVLEGRSEASIYTGEPLFKGFPWDEKDQA